MEPDTPAATKLLALLERWWAQPRTCPVCAHNKWTISESLVEIHPYHGGNLVVGGSVYPAALVVCVTCGYTMFFNALAAQLIDQPAAEPDAADSEES